MTEVPPIEIEGLRVVFQGDVTVFVAEAGI